MFNFFKRKPDSAAQVDKVLGSIVDERFKNPEFKAAVVRELESFADAKDISQLEATLFGLQIGQATLSQLVTALVNSNVLILAKAPDDPRSGLILTDTRDKSTRIALFTSEKRAAKAMEKNPGLRSLIALPARNLIRHTPDVTGIVINPFEPVVTCNFTPQQLVALKSDLARTSATPPPVPGANSPAPQPLPPIPRPQATPPLPPLPNQPTARPTSPAPPPPPPQTDPSKDPNLIRAFDAYGREIFITREQWRDNVLRGNLREAWDKPDELYGMIVGALDDGFRAEIIDASRHLYETDFDHVRGACLWGVVLLEENRLDEAEAVFRDHTERHVEDGTIFTNWAKIYAKRNDATKVEQLLWHALELNPNLDNGMAWYEGLHREQGGQEAGIDALRRVADLPGSWRARLWLARHALDQRQLDQALVLYRECLVIAPRPVPTDLLMGMSGDLGNHAHLPEILQLCEPCFEPALHGIQVGNNLIKAHLDLGQLDAAHSILDQLYAQKRPDWQQTLNFWDNAIAKARVEVSCPQPDKIEVGMATLNGPIWLREDSLAPSLFAAKSHSAPVVAFIGSSTDIGEKRAQAELSNTSGRISRALPLFLSEQIHLTTSAAGMTLTPFIQNGGTGFVVMGGAWEADQGCHLARQSAPPADYLVVLHLVAREEPWKVEMIVYRTIDQAVLGTVRSAFTPAQPETSFAYLAEQLKGLLHNNAETESIANSVYQVPGGGDFPYYLLRLEQALAVTCSQSENRNDFLSGEREIIDGILQLNLKLPQNVVTRLLLAQTLRQMKRVRPGILPEFREKIALLQKENPLPTPAHSIAQQLLDEALATP